MEYFSGINFFIRILGLLIQYVGVFFVAGGVMIALVRLPMKAYRMEDIRGRLARRIIFGLEFIIAGDLLHATIAVDFNEIVQLGAIVGIRILLGYSLRKEVDLK